MAKVLPTTKKRKVAIVRKKQHFLVPMAIYHSHLLVCFGYTDSEVIDIFNVFEDVGYEKQKGWRFDDNKKAGHVTMFDGNKLFLRLRDFPEVPEDFGTLAHEIFHVVELLMHRIGSKLTDSSSEPYAYLIGYLTQEIYKQIETYGGTKKKPDTR